MAAARLIELALQHHRSGRFAQAEDACRQALAVEPNNVDVLHFSGVLAFERRDYSRAQEFIRLALAQDAGNAAAHNDLGNVFAAQGRPDEAMRSYIAALALQPDYADALCNLGRVFRERNQPDEAEKCYRRALAAAPGLAAACGELERLQRDRESRIAQLLAEERRGEGKDAQAHIDLGKRLRACGLRDKAFAHFGKALSLAPDFGPALYQAGNAHLTAGELDQAIACYSRALAADPDFADAHINLGYALQARGRLDEAASSYRRALALAPNIADTHLNLGNVHRERGELEAARECYEKALALAPDLVPAYVNLGNVKLRLARAQEAIACFRSALALEPDMSETHYNLGMAAHHAGMFAPAKAALVRYLAANPDDKAALITLADAHRNLNEVDAARSCYERVLALDPAAPDAHNGLANVLRNQARHDSAVAHYELAIRHDPRPVVALQNLLFCMLCMGRYTERDIYERHREFARRFEEPLRSLQRAHANRPDPERRLKIGYVSPDFRSNVVAQYVEPILRHHDRTRFEVRCYFTGAIRDELTGTVASLVEQWHDVHALSDDAFAALIRSHGIDVLVDLCGHGPGNRILVFARKPAPVQINYLDYSATTGLDSIDYRLTTEACDPTGRAEQYYSEKLVRLPRTYWTYNPSVRLPVSPLPLESNGYPTFGSFSLYYRITAEVLQVWARLLRAVPRSRLLIIGVAQGSTREALLEAMRGAEIAPERILAHDVVPYQRYNELMASVDVALAPFPYNGATTMLDCLWNGVPVVALRGREMFYSRMGESLLGELGLERLIGNDADEYVRIAAALTDSAAELAALRAKLREKLERSAMRDFRGFTQALEAAYRTLWAEWCSK
jgi:protein O-GlcNAc transferase